MSALPARGEVWWSETPACSRRPVVVLSRDRAVWSLRRTVVAPCTTLRGLPSEVELEPGPDPVPRTCVVNLDSIEAVPIESLVERLGRLSDARMRAVCAAPRSRGRLRAAAAL